MFDEKSTPTINIDSKSIANSFTQSEYWELFQKKLGKKTHRYSGKGWTALCIEQKIPTGYYWYLPYGPYATGPTALANAVTAISVEARRTGCLWLRLEPRLGTPPMKKMLRAPRDVNPSDTTMLDLRIDMDTLIHRLSKTNRQRINRQNKQHDLCFWTSTDPADIRQFTAMQDIVSKRTGASFLGEDYLQTQASILMPLDVMRIEFTGYQSNSPIAGAIIHDYEDTATYTYAASRPEARDAGAANLLLWQSIINAKQRGLKTYDFWGVAPKDAKNSHPWKGFSDFKRSFGTVDVSFAGTWDMPLSRQYYIYRSRTKLLSTAKKLKQKVRGRSKNSYR